MDWVEARVCCSVKGTWTSLKEIILSDIDRWRELTKAAPGSLTVVAEDHRIAITRADLEGGKGHSAMVQVRNSHIELRRSQPNSEAPNIVKLIPVLNRQGECRLRLGNDELEFWQASREALETVLFG